MSNLTADEADGDLTRSIIREKIAHVLTIFPIISRTMLNVGIGTAIPPALWKPVLQGMIDEGIVLVDTIQCETPNGYHRAFNRVLLADKSLVKRPNRFKRK